MRCEKCEQAERVAVRRAKMVERDGRVAVVTGVPMEECPACGERWLSLEVAELLDGMLRRLIGSGADSATAHWDELVSTAA
jgi:YgiT-type zinc finger domain-containing protein